jgi:hypothetical protein
LLKDGRSARVPLYMRDGVTPLQRAVMDSKQTTVITTSNPSMVVDAFGGTAGLSRPGFRYLHAGHKTVDHAVQVSREILRDEAYRAYDAEESRRWQGVTGTTDRSSASVPMMP